MKKPNDAAEKLLNVPYESLDERTKKVARHIAVILVIWVGLNLFILMQYENDKIFDPYPYILLNLFLSMLAAIQAPIILMSQNRQAEKDRLHAEYDYEVNLKAELEIMLLHEKVDLLREGQWGELLAIQKEQLRLLGDLIEKKIVAE